MPLAAEQTSAAAPPPHHLTVTVAKSALRAAVNRIARIVPARAASPGLTLARVEVAPGKLTLSGANLDCAIRVAVPVDATATGTFAVPAAPLHQVINSAPGDEVTLEHRGAELTVVSGPHRSRLQTAAPDALAPLEFPEAFAGQVPAETLAALLERTSYAAATAEFQQSFRGVLLDLTAERARAVATDGFRLAYQDAPPIPGLEAKALLPAKLASEVTRAFTEGDVFIDVSGDALVLADQTTTLKINLMSGKFPDYERVIPKGHAMHVTLDAKALRDLLARVSLMSDKTANNRVDLHVKDGRLTVTGEGSYGSAREELDVTQGGAESEIRLAVNASFLTAAVAPAEGAVTLNLNHGAAPLTVVDHEDPAYLALVVPLKTQ